MISSAFQDESMDSSRRPCRGVIYGALKTLVSKSTDRCATLYLSLLTSETTEVFIAERERVSQD